MSENRRKLQNLLRELFQFDAADLDFGIYAVMNRKRAEVARFIERDILVTIESGLATLSAVQQEEAEAQYREALRALEAEVADEYPIIDAKGDLTAAAIAAGGRTIRQLRKDFLDAKQAREDARLSADLEAQVYNDLYRFFARYYDDGDFIPLRRYGADDKYAVPYNGEEVMLHWANADQYYVKSGEYFTDYRFHLAGTLAAEPAQVVFKLIAATVAQNNVKGEKRFFALGPGAPVAWDEGDRALMVAFEYRMLTDDEKRRTGTQKQQEKLNAEAEAAILRQAPEPSVRSWLAATDGDAKPGNERTALARHLTRYTARNTRDYFIHKDLGRFLERELDFFLGNEVLKVDDISWSQPGQVRRYALRVQTIRDIGRTIIAFLAQIEDFQRRLWEKRKFVVQSDYCVTLDRVPSALYPEIAANDRQRGEWTRLYGLELGADADPPKHPYAMVDTAFFDADFKARLLATFDDLDAACDGVLVHGENFQALNLLTSRYGGQVNCIYIDPPYNTGNDDFPYKDGYQASSWLCMLQARILLGQRLQSDTGLFFFQIGDDESGRSRLLLEGLFAQRKNSVVVRRGIKNVQAQFETIERLSVGHDVIHVLAKQEGMQLPHLRQSLGEDRPGKWDTFWRGTDRRTMRYELFGQTPDSGQWRWEEDRAKKAKVNYEYFVQHESGNKTLDEWYVENLQAGSNLDFVRLSDDGVAQYYVPPQGARLVSDNWLDLSSAGTFTDFPHEKNLDLLRRIIGWNTIPGDVVLDFFAGSGSVGHAAMTMPPGVQGKRRYLLVEMADYFDTILKPRIQKVAYAADWRDGKPLAGSPGQSHMFHYLRLESYEDTLNNLRFRSLDGPLFAALDAMPDYLLHYMLDYETAGSPSLLDAEQFKRPFAYQLNITRHDVTEPRVIDLVTTFNFLLGLRVRTIRRFERESALIMRVTGEDPSGRRVCVLWRDVPPLEEMEAEKAWLQAEALTGVAYDLLYINGESALPGALAIEPEFKRLMFS